MKRIIWWCIFLLCLGGLTVAAQQYWPRFHRYALTRLDDTTTLDMVKDAKTGVCRLVYRAHQTWRGPHDGHSGWQTDYHTVAVTYLGEVPCDPAPVPPKVGDAPPASVVR